MPRVTVYYFTKYDITVGEVVLSQRPATLETIVLCEGKLIEETAQQVDVSELDGDGFYTPKVDSGGMPEMLTISKHQIELNNKNRTSSPSDISAIEEGESLPAPLNTRLGNSLVSEQ
jgi:hypothetical protein